MNSLRLWNKTNNSVTLDTEMPVSRRRRQTEEYEGPKGLIYKKIS